MLGAILGDIIGSPYEFDMGDKTKDFPLFIEESQFTDDTVMTVAVADALSNCSRRWDEDYENGWYYKNVAPTEENKLKDAAVKSMQYWGRKYPFAGYGSNFSSWLFNEIALPYNSYGNGSAMRVSPVAWKYNDIDTVRRVARLTAEVSHNHPEGIKGAESVASAIFLARTGHRRKDIKEYIETEFGYDLSRTCDEIRPTYCHDESCQRTVPEAITAFLEGNSYEDVIRTAVSLGGDCDTLTCISGSIAEGYYGMPKELINECLKRLPSDLKRVVERFLGIVR